MRRIGVGVIGFGWLGQAHTCSLRAPLMIGVAAGRSLREGRPVRVEEIRP
jgi:hypothetical protein